MKINEEIRERLLEKGATIVGFADLSGIEEEKRHGYQYGILIGISVNPQVIPGIKDGPTFEYYYEYESLNTKLNSLGEFAERFLREKGFEALAKTQEVVVIDEATRSTELPHKTVATRAGVGWIGKCALLVTEKFGSAVRIISVLTNAGLETGIPINDSKCGDCIECVKICPAGAPLGENWDVNKYRDEFYNAFECRKAARERSMRIGINESHCGLCILACPWTKRYIERTDK
ncbi:MAG: epoxyqueuosine reductase [Clostridiales bacterium]|nr:epoxyqueuosine reductase [Clostridiales bacterium]